MKQRMKKIMSVLVTLCLVTGLFMHLGATEEVHAAPATGVSLYSPDGSVKIDLDNGNYYFVDGAAALSGVLGQNNCTAFFDKDTATLTLDGYNYGSITVRDFTNNDLKIILKGTNKITNTSDYAAIYSINGVLEITSDSAGTLEIDVKANMDGVCGIASGYAGGQVDGTVIISGDANLNICVVNESEEYTSFAYGVFARNSIEIKDNASITIKPVTMGTAPDHASGLYLATQGSDPKGISINTLGKVDIDTSGIAGNYSFPIFNSANSGGCNLTKVDTMTLKYKTSVYANDAYPSFTYDENHFAKRSMDEQGVTTTVYKYGTSHTISIMTGIFNSGLEEVASEISGLENEIVTITAPDLYGLEFKEWVLLSDVEFADNTDVKSNPAKIKVGSSDISIRATYKAFSKEPTFILTGETIGEGNYPVGKIEYTCAKDYDFGIYLISENGYMYGCGGEECEAIYYIDADLKYACCSGLDSDVYYLDPGTYRIATHEKIVRDGAVKYNIMLFYYSEPFTVSYSKPIKGIEITTVPTKTIYTAGEGFDPTGMEIKVTYEDESFEILSEGFTWSPENAFANNDDKVTISYTLNGETYTTDLAVTVNPSYDVLESIELTTPPTKTNYIEGQSFDPAGMVVTGTYEGGVSKEITGYTIAPSGALTVNDSVITITYILNGKTCTTTQEITVEPKCLESITIITPPTKTKYEIGDRFDKTGMVVTAKWNDDCTEVITAYKCTPEYFESITDTEVTISFTDAFRIGNITKTAKQAVTVKALDSISITTSPDKTVYTHLESFDKTGMVVTAKYSDNSTAEIKDYIIAPAGGLNTTDTSVTISYTEKGITKTAIQAITVNERDDLEEIIILRGPDKTAYVAGEIFAPAGMIVDAVYNNASALISYLYGFDNINGPLTFSPSGALSVDDTIITISYTEGGITKTVTQEITVTAANSGNNETGNNGSENTENNNSGNGETGNNGSGNTENNNSGNSEAGNNGSGNAENNNSGNNGTGNSGSDNNNSGSSSGSGSGSTYIPVSTTPTPTPEVPGTTTKVVTDLDGSKTTITRTLEESGKVTETTVKESKNGDKTTTEVVIDESGKASTTTEVVSTDNKGTTTVTTSSRKSDGSVTGSTVKTYESGKVVSNIKETKADKSVKTVEETKQADGSTLKTVTKVSAGGSVKMTVTAEVPAADGKKAKKTEFVYSMTASGKAKLVKVTTNDAEITIPATVNINGIQCKVVTIGKSAFKGNISITKVVIGKYVETIGTKAFAGLTNLKEININTAKLSKVSKSAFYKISKDAKFYIKAKKSACKAIAALITKSGVKKVNYERVK